MKIVFDPVKRLTNIEKHDGLDFADLTAAFFDAAGIFPAKKNRLLAVGMFRGVVMAVIYSWLGTEAISVISMRRASRKERDLL